jgi:prolyl oligopeptidase
VALGVLPIVLLLAMAPPVPTRSEVVVDKLHGVEVRDPYRWLEQGDADEVTLWTERQNAVLRHTLDREPARPFIERRLWQLHEIGTLGVPVARADKQARATRYFYTRRTGKQNQPVLYLRRAVDGADQTLIDVNTLAADGTMSLDWWTPSEDGHLVAYGVSVNGDENATLRIRDVATGKDLPDTITRARYCSLAWQPDGKGFYYTRYPAAGTVPAGEDVYHRAVFHHRLGDDPQRDSKIFGDGRDLKDWPDLALSPDGRWLGIEVQQGWARSEIFLVDTHHRGKPVPVVTGRAALFTLAEVLDDRIYVLSNEGAPRYRLFSVDPRHPERARWRETIAEGTETLQAVAAVGGKLAALYLEDASSRVRLFSAAGKLERELPLPGLGTATGLSGRNARPELFFSFTSYLTPTMVFRHDVEAAASSVWQKLEAPLDPAGFEVEQTRYRSRDGTHIPMFLVHRKGLVRDGKTPALLSGYGGFNISLTPTFAAAVAPFIEAGGVYAVANLRGGGEYGEAWHEAGMLGNKQNVFDDVIAAAEHLIAEKITSPAHLAISGRSNGGLLVGAAITQRPDLFRAAICGVPLLDMLRYHQFRIAKLWVPEYGSSDDPQQFRWLAAYSPYHHVKDGVDYPATLFFTAASDTRVDPLHARKMTARLQAATTGRKGPVLLRLETQAGHGAGKPLAKLLAQHTDELTFLFQELGLKAPAQ